MQANLIRIPSHMHLMPHRPIIPNAIREEASVAVKIRRRNGATNAVEVCQSRVRDRIPKAEFGI